MRLLMYVSCNGHSGLVTLTHVLLCQWSSYAYADKTQEAKRVTDELEKKAQREDNVNRKKSRSEKKLSNAAWSKQTSRKDEKEKRKDKKVWDEEKQEWVNRWGWKGANKDKEVQWLTEVPANAGASIPSVLTLHPHA